MFDDGGEEIEIPKSFLFHGPSHHHGDIVIVARVAGGKVFLRAGR